MTKTEKQFILDQISIIDAKIDEDNLRRYATLLSGADLTEEVRGYLTRAVNIKMEAIASPLPMAVAASFD